MEIGEHFYFFSDDEDYSDISDLSDPENADDSSKANAFADGDDSASDYEGNVVTTSSDKQLRRLGETCRLTCWL